MGPGRRAMMRARHACLGAMVALAAALPARAETLTVGVRAPFGVDPHFMFTGPNMAAARHIYDSLINRDVESRFIPGIVESWTAIEPTVWEMKLRHGVKFHDGSPFDAEDIAFSIKRVPAVPNNPGPYNSNLRTITGVEVVDPYTVRIRTAFPNPTLIGQLTNIFIVSSRAARGDGGPAGAPTSDFTSGKAAVGTGPFRLRHYNGAEGMSLVRNETYWGEPAAFEEVEIKVLGNDATRLAALLSGQVDLIESVSTTDVARLSQDPRISVFQRSSDRVMFLIPNIKPDTLPLLVDADGKPLDRNPLKDVRVRRALSLALDRKLLSDRAMDGQATPTVQIIPEQFAGYDPAMTVPPANVAEAKKLLAEAGYPQGFGMTVGCTNNRWPNDARICQVIGQMFERIGLKMTVETQPQSVFFPRTVATKNDVPVMMYGLSTSSARDPSYVLSSAIHTRQPARSFGQGNRGNYSNPALDAKIEAAVQLSGPDREPTLRALMREALADYPIIPMYYPRVIAAGRRGIVYEPRMDEQLVAYHARPVAAP